jgi:vancomycin resistance protein VanW
MRKLLRKIVPAEWRLQSRIWLNQRKYKNISLNGGWAVQTQNQLKLVDQIEVGQLFTKTARSENKKYNIKLAIQQLERVLILPGQAFSYWHCIGRPSQKKGFKSGRNLINGVLTEDVGGGLCQLAGIIYHTALIAGLDILERHNHSLDIYTEAERYTPLGADASVVYGYKDLKLINPYQFPVQLRFSIDDQQLRCTILAEESMPKHEVQFIRAEEAGWWKVSTIRVGEEGKKEALSVSSYQKLDKA